MREAKTKQKPGVVIFVHGFISSPACWDELRDLLTSDDRVMSSLDLDFFEYHTEVLDLPFLRPLPTIQQVALELAEFVGREKFSGYRDITLVGHSLGGLVIQEYLAGKLTANRGDDLERVRQVILFGTPNRGSMLADAARRIITALVLPHRQEYVLRVLNAEVSDLQVLMSERVVDAARRTPGERPIPVQCFYGEQDDIVVEPSARGCFDCVDPLPGDHFSLIRPVKGSEHYRKIADALLEPAGHRNVFEIDEWGISLRVEPRRADVPVVVEYGGQRHPDLFTDNYAHLTRSVRFGRKNRCRGKFDLSYKVNKLGYLKPRPSDPNEAEPTKAAEYGETGTDYCYEFTARAGKLFTLDADIYKGFDAGKRDVHFHLGQSSRYKKIRARLDLSAYKSAGFAVTDEPKLYLHERDSLHNVICSNRALINPTAYARTDPRGVWEWECDNVREGVVDLKWDVADAPSP